MKYRLVATAGHVDHGKTALLKEMTGTDADRLEEEQERGLTVDLGFADLVQDDCHVGFIDVPGHHNFIKNMVSGVGAVQGILFVVSAVDGWQAQSREHFEIINLLSPDSVVFAVTKIDLADDDFVQLVQAEIEEAIEETPYEDAPIVQVSSETGEGIDHVRRCLFEEISQTPDPPDHQTPYCPIDRVFSVKGQGTVVTGSLSGGDLSTDQNVLLEPDGIDGTVRGLQQYHEPVKEAHRSARVAVNVPDWEPDNIDRGDILTIDGAGTSASVVDGLIELPRTLNGQLDHDQQVLAYLGTDRYEARILTPDQRSYQKRDEGPIRIKRLETDGYFRPGDRIIVRDFSDRYLLGCVTIGRVSPDRSLSDGDYLEWLRRRIPVTLDNYVLTELEERSVCEVETLAGGSRFSRSELLDTAGDLDAVRVFDGDRLIHETWWESRLGSIRDAVDSYHEEHPHRPGMDLSDIDLERDLAREPLFEELEREGYAVEGNIVCREDFEPALNEEQQRELETLLDDLREAGLETPDRSELEDRYSDAVIEYALFDDLAVLLSEERLVETSVYDRLRARVIEFMSDGEPRRLSELRDCLESSRQYVIPFMEYLDQQNVTVRSGDVRHLRE